MQAAKAICIGYLSRPRQLISKFYTLHHEQESKSLPEPKLEVKVTPEPQA